MFSFLTHLYRIANVRFTVIKRNFAKENQLNVIALTI